MTFRFMLLATLVSAGAAGCVHVAQGQISATLDAGGMHVRHDGGEGAGAFTFSPALRVDGVSLSLDAAGTLARFRDSWSAQANVAMSYFTRTFGPVQGELEATLEGSAQPAATETGAAGGGVRLHLLGEHRGVWLGAQAGRASDGLEWRSTIAADLGGWIRRGGTTAVLRVTPSTVGNALRYIDAYAAARLERGRLEIAGSLGIRDWTEPVDVATTAWGSLSGAFWLGDHLALSLGGGTYPTDFTQGFAAGRYISAGVRVATHRPTSRQAISSTLRHTLPPVEQPVAEEFQARSAPGGAWTLEVAAPGADRVELMGDFTDWRAVPFRRRADGRWSVTLPIAPGTHRMNLRVDAGAWGVPPGLPILTDEFSGIVALLDVR